MPLGIKVGLGPGGFVFDGDPAPPKKKGTVPTQFLVHIYCGQMAGWIKMPLGTEVNLGTGDVVVDGVAAPPERGTAPPVFSPCLLWSNGWMDEDATWYGTRPWCRPHCVTWGPSSPHPRERDTAAPLFSAYICCGHGRPSQLLLSSCWTCCNAAVTDQGRLISTKQGCQIV